MSTKPTQPQGRKRNYYKAHEGTSSNRYKMFLVRYCEEGNDVSSYDGPYGDMDDALDKVSEYLKEGTCAWMIGYNE
jgi:hypothetical protein